MWSFIANKPTCEGFDNYSQSTYEALDGKRLAKGFWPLPTFFSLPHTDKMFTGLLAIKPVVMSIYVLSICLSPRCYFIIGKGWRLLVKAILPKKKRKQFLSVEGFSHMNVLIFLKQAILPS